MRPAINQYAYKGFWFSNQKDEFFLIPHMLSEIG